MRASRSAQAVGDRLLRPLAGREALRLHGEVAGEVAVELVVDRLQEARAEAVHGHHQGEADHQRGRGGRGRAGIGAGRVGGQAALDREHAVEAARRAPRTSGRITNGATQRDPEEDRDRPEHPGGGDDASSSRRTAPSQKAPASPSGIRTAPISARRGRRAARSPSVPSTALIGDVRPARRAGYSAPRTAVMSPVATAAIGAKPENARSPTGKLSARISAISPSASATPSPSPSTAPSTPEQRRLAQHRPGDHPSARAERPQHADLPRALEDGHVERVEDQEAADEEGHRGEEVEDHVEGLELLLDVGGLALRASATLTPLGSARRRLPLDPGDRLGSPPLTTRSISSKTRGLSISRRAGGERHPGEPLPAEVEPGGELEQADDPQPL